MEPIVVGMAECRVTEKRGQTLVTYGLGSENQDLPAYVVLLSGPLAGAGTSLWSPGFLPSLTSNILHNKLIRSMFFHSLCPPIL